MATGPNPPRTPVGPTMPQRRQDPRGSAIPAAPALAQPAQADPPAAVAQPGPAPAQKATAAADFVPTMAMEVVPPAGRPGALLPPGPGGQNAYRAAGSRPPTVHHVSRLEWTAGKPLSGRYRMIDKLGEGGMGTVYLADDLLLRRKVAVKALWDEDLFEPDDIERFRKEVALAHAVSHPAIARTYDLGEMGGVHYITMEYLRGKTLMQRIKDGPVMSSAEVRDLAVPMCRGLRAAHKAGVVHRDLKPANIMLTGGERKVAIMDFGIAASFQDIREGLTSAPTHRPDGKVPGSWDVTSAGLGTPVYMAPEQWDSGTGDPRTDIYALGVILYICLTGQAPYSADTTEELAQMHKSAPVPDVTRLAKQTDADLAKLIRDCLAKDPQKRPRDMDEVLERLEKPARRKAYVLQLGLGSLGTALGLFVIGFALYQLVASALIKELKPALRRLAVMTADAMDPAELDAIRGPNDVGGPAWRKVKARLSKIHAANPEATYFYVLRPRANQSEWPYVYDLDNDLNGNGRIDPGSDEVGKPPGATLDIRTYPRLSEAWLQGQPSTDEEFAQDEFHIVLSGYAPLPSGSVRPPYMVGVDVTSAPLESLLTRLWLILGAGQLAAMAAMAVWLAPSRRFRRALAKADQAFARET